MIFKSNDNIIDEDRDQFNPEKKDLDTKPNQKDKNADNTGIELLQSDRKD
jgi:hypothetical protein